MGQGIKLIGIFLVATACSVLTGFAAGFTYGTGDSALTLLVPAKSIAPPQETVMTTLSDVTATLSTQPKQAYREGYNCVDYAWDAMRALQWRGQPSAIVRLGFSDGTGHTVLIAPTSDKGYQFVEPQTDEIIRPQVGAMYAGKTVANMTVLEFQWRPFDVFVLDPNYALQGWDDPE